MGSIAMPEDQNGPSSASKRSTCREAAKTAEGPFAVPPPYEVVASKGTGRMTTRAVSGVKGKPKIPSPEAAASGSKSNFVLMARSARQLSPT